MNLTDKEEKDLDTLVANSAVEQNESANPFAYTGWTLGQAYAKLVKLIEIGASIIPEEEVQMAVGGLFEAFFKRQENSESVYTHLPRNVMNESKKYSEVLPFLLKQTLNKQIIRTVVDEMKTCDFINSLNNIGLISDIDAHTGQEFWDITRGYLRACGHDSFKRNHNWLKRRLILAGHSWEEQDYYARCYSKIKQMAVSADRFLTFHREMHKYYLAQKSAVPSP